ncbi:MAG: GtrA family protein [Candidatus Cohnella colombiensis]|uniref:GtrA family protein n=1 Tax=Candidatus Cohnella colombiensis TaxID=3121368 RepID=A0AA95JAY5_9BACL|nr:MAG: GtrA family protein [Cohnella sp.]
MNRRTELLKLIKYGLVGAMNTGVDFIVFCILVYGVGWGTVGAQVLAYSAGLMNSYLLNRYWTFRTTHTQSKQSKQIIRFVVVNAISFASATLVLLALEQWGIHTVVAKMLSIAASLVLNYVGYRLWVFRKEPYNETMG